MSCGKRGGVAGFVGISRRLFPVLFQEFLGGFDDFLQRQSHDAHSFIQICLSAVPKDEFDSPVSERLSDLIIRWPTHDDGLGGGLFPADDLSSEFFLASSIRSGKTGFPKTTCTNHVSLSFMAVSFPCRVSVDRR